MLYFLFSHQAYIDAAEIMLTDDVADNKAIGFHGASFLPHQLKDSEKLSVLTHCNTGRFIKFTSLLVSFSFI